LEQGTHRQEGLLISLPAASLIAFTQWRRMQAAAAIQMCARPFQSRRAVPARRRLISMITKIISLLSAVSAEASRRRKGKFEKIGFANVY
jgi:hypothetical protein